MIQKSLAKEHFRMICRFFAAVVVLTLAVFMVVGEGSAAFADQQQSYSQSDQTSQADQQSEYSQSQEDYSYANNQANQQEDQSGQAAQNEDQNQQQAYQSEQ